MTSITFIVLIRFRFFINAIVILYIYNCDVPMVLSLFITGRFAGSDIKSTIKID